MEHRCSKRNENQQNVVVKCPRRGLVSANIGNISLDGMYVQMDGFQYPLGAPVLAAFDLPVETFHDDFRLEAMVVRHTTAGVGLMFLEMEGGIRRALQAALYGTPSFAPA